MSGVVGRVARPCGTLQDALGKAVDGKGWKALKGLGQPQNVIRLMFAQIPGSCHCLCEEPRMGLRARLWSPNAPGGQRVDRSLGPVGESRPGLLPEQAQKAGQAVGGGQALRLLLLA